MDESENTRSKAQEFNEKMKILAEKLELKDNETIRDIALKENISLGGRLEENSALLVSVRSEDGSLHYVAIDRDINKILNIDKDGKMELSDREKKIWEDHIGKPGEQRADQRNLYDFNKEYFFQEYNENQHDIGENNSINEQEKDVAKGMGVDENSILCVIKIEDRDTFGQAINRNLKADSYIVKFGNNKIKIMETSTGYLGDLKEVTGLEYSEFSSEVLDQLNVPTHGNDLRIRPGDLKTIRDDEKGCKYVVVSRENDPNNGIVIVNSLTKVSAYTFNDRDKDSMEELRTSIVSAIDNSEIENEEDKSIEELEENEEEEIQEEQIKEENEKEEEEYEGRTPWRDAEARQHR